jgi:hypothetical protein
MIKTLLAKQVWKIKDTEIHYCVYTINDMGKVHYEIEILKETFRITQNELGDWVTLEGEKTEDTSKWGEVIELVLKDQSPGS